MPKAFEFAESFSKTASSNQWAAKVLQKNVEEILMLAHGDPLLGVGIRWGVGGWWSLVGNEASLLRKYKNPIKCRCMLCFLIENYLKEHFCCKNL